MPSLSWYVQRLRTMSAAEVYWRVGRAARTRVTGRPTPEAEDELFSETGSDWSARLESFRRAVGRPSLLSAQRARNVAAENAALVEPLLLAADDTRECRFSYFGYSEVALPRPVDWNYDPIADFRWPSLDAAQLDWRSMPADVKWVWELNRLQHLPLLATAWRFTGEPAYAQAALEQLDSWLEQCPPGVGIGWHGGFEAGVRSVSIALALDGLSDSSLLTPDRYRSYVSLLAASARRCWAERSLYSSANNHLIGEMAGLAVIAIMWPELREAKRWERSAIELLTREIDRLIHPDGSGAEQSAAYQVFTTELVLIVAALLQQRDGDAPPALTGAIIRSAEYLSDLVGDGDPEPRYGDDDNGFALRLGPEPVRSVREHLAIVGRFAGVRELRQRGTSSLTSAWFATTRVNERRTSPRESFHAPDGGLVVLRSQHRRVTMDVAPLGHLSIAAHGHADALALTVCQHGRELVTDPGMGSYYGDPDLRTAQRGTRSHATVCVDGVDQSVMGGPFMWTRHARVHLNAVDLEAGVIDAWHDGYQRLRQPVTHRRWLYAPPDSAVILVLDLLTGNGAHTAEVSWPLPPDLSAHATVGGHLAQRDGGDVLALDYAVTSPFELTQVRGDPEKNLGWWSDRLESRRAAWLLGIRATGPLPIGLATVLRPDPDETSSIEGLGVSLDGEGVTVSWLQGGRRRTVVADTRGKGSIAEVPVEVGRDKRVVDSSLAPASEGTAKAPTKQDAPHGLRQKVGRVAAASVVGFGLGQLITIVQTVILARLLTPYQVGLFAAGSVLMAFMANLVEGGMRTALVQRRDSVAEATETVFWATVVSGLVMSVLALAAAPLVGVLFDSHDAGVIGAAIAPTMFLFALSSVPDALLQREFNVRRRFIVDPSVGAAFAIVSIAGALWGLGVWSLVIGTYAQCVALLLTTWTVCRWRPGRVRPSYRLWRELARYGFPLTVATMLIRSRDVLFRVVVARSLGTATLGQYRYGERLAQIPFLAVLGVGSYALLPGFARVAHDADRLRRTFLDALRWGSLGGAAAAGLLAALGQTAVVLLLGDQWREAGLIAATMAGLALGTAWSAAGGEALSAAGRTVRSMNTTVINILAGLALLAVLIGPFGARGVGLSISIAQLLAGAIVLVATRPVVQVSGRTMARTVAPTVLAAIVAAGATYGFDHWVAHAEDRPIAWGLLMLCGETLLFSVLFLAICALLDRPVRSGLGAGIRLAHRRARPGAARAPLEHG